MVNVGPLMVNLGPPMVNVGSPMVKVGPPMVNLGTLLVNLRPPAQPTQKLLIEKILKAVEEWVLSSGMHPLLTNPLLSPHYPLPSAKKKAILTLTHKCTHKHPHACTHAHTCTQLCKMHNTGCWGAIIDLLALLHSPNSLYIWKQFNLCAQLITYI